MHPDTIAPKNKQKSNANLLRDSSDMRVISRSSFWGLRPRPLIAGYMAPRHHPPFFKMGKPYSPEHERRKLLINPNSDLVLFIEVSCADYLAEN